MNGTQHPSFQSCLLEDCPMSPGLTAFLALSYGAVMLLGLLGNACLICVIVRQKEKANVTSILITNLSVSDVLVCVLCLPVTVAYTLMDHWAFGGALCRLLPFVQCTSVSVSVLSLVLIALERHQLILNPAGWKPSAPQAYLAVVLIWTLACLTSLPFLAFHTLTDEPYRSLPPPLRDKEACTESWPSPAHKLAYTTWLLLFQYCGPLLLVLVCYLRVFGRLRRRRDMLDRAGAENRRLAHSRRVNAMLAALVASFAVCWLPLNAFNALADWHHEALLDHHDLAFSLCHLLAMASTCVNPVVYGFLNSNFKKEVRAGLRRCCCRPPEDKYQHFALSTVHTELSKTSLRVHCRNNSV
ncbi:neuropeptide Y receptor type 4-2-like isoform X2 [Conger conger]|uniref:neuropeptide Y receptor type 4-2-like isoform X2 n=1 Tax=Conger conger TaxID=82655 RepID=UPI002A59CEA8|nr:neuropeptide Y receptor type 4-2-like isoform X2 [Conger conger]